MSRQSNSNQNNQFVVSVVIPVYNSESDLPDLIAGLEAQTYPREQVEYLLVDNRSGDRSAAIIQSSAERLVTQGITLRLLQETQIQSAYAARNRGIRHAQGEIIAFIDADCRPQSEWLTQLIAPFSDSQVGFVVGEIEALPGNTLLERYADRTQVLSQKFVIEHPHGPYGQTANLAVRRLAFEQVGLFRPYLTTGGDADMCWRIQAATDWQFMFAPQAVVRHRHRSNWRSLRTQWQKYGSSTRYLHELHGSDLMRELTPREIAYRLTRWLLKELPRDTVKLITQKGDRIDLIKTPIDLFTFQARTVGQQTAQLSESARQIEWLEKTGRPPEIGP